jgi:anti-sigma factor RsiW
VSRKTDPGTALRGALPTYTAPESLRQFVREHAPADGVMPAPVGDIPRSRTLSPLRLSLYAAGLVIAAIVGWTANNSLEHRRQSVASQHALVAELADTHVRSLMGDHLMDVRSTDQHTVKPWFTGKIDFAPRVIDLAAKGFPLLGGRVDYIGGHNAAALVYGRRRHVVNLFIWPASASDSAETSQRYNGYSMKHWVADGFSYWAVSDAAPAELDAFRQAYESAT